jgi:predicted DNA-binding transcriptional regulator AlpA
MNDIVERIANGSAQLLGIDDICQRLSISRTTFDRWVRNGGGKNPGNKITVGSLVADSIMGQGYADRLENMNEGMITFPPPDIRIGNSPKWEVQTFKRWLKENAQPGK